MILRERFALRLGWFQAAAVLLLGVTAAPAWSQRADEKHEADYRAQLKEREMRGAEVRARDELDLRSLQMGLDLTRAGEEAAPNAAAAIVAEFERQKTIARIEMEQRIEKQRQATLARLRDLAAKLDQVGNVHEAQAVRDYMKKLEPAQMALPDPGTLVDYRDRVGQTFVFQVTGQDAGTIWGSQVYTDDSPLGATAVHAGLLKVGETGLVRVHILPGRESYQGDRKNGIMSRPYGEWYGSYTISSARRNMVMAAPRGNEAQWLRGRGMESTARMPKAPVLEDRDVRGKTDPMLWEIEVEAVPPAAGAVPAQP